MNLKPTYVLNFITNESRVRAGHDINTRTKCWESAGCRMISDIVNIQSVLSWNFVTGSSRFQLKTPLEFFGAEKANSFHPNPEAKRDYAN
ncbi:hypothetical protein TNCV_754481 [Trichonephila clavipes]|nr:hypothetical protein TNCV_754481 [Trichonephila clavipes]